MGLGILEIIVLLVLCALVIAALRNPSWKTLVALPLGILVLLGTATMLFSLAAPRYRAVPSARVEFQNSSFEQKVFSGLDDHSLQVPTASRGVLSDMGGPSGLGRLFLIVPVMLAIGLFVTIPILCSKWIKEHRSLVIPAVCVAAVSFVVVANVAAFSFFLSRSSTEEARRAQIVHQLRAIGESLHQSSTHDNAVPVAAVQPVVSQSAEDSESAADAAASTLAGSETGATSESPAATEATADAALAPVELPDWIRGHELEINDLTRSPVLLASEQWSTVQESEVQIEQLASVAVLHQLRQQRPDLDGWRPNNDFLHQSGALRQRFVEQTSLKVGEFESPMYRSYWQVAVTPQVSDMAYSQWKATAIEKRVIGLGGGAAAITLVFAAIAAGLRIDLATSGRYRRHLFAAVGFITSLGAGIVLFS